MQNKFWFKQKFGLDNFEDLQQYCEQHQVRISENADSPLINLVYKETAKTDDFFANCCRGIVLNKTDLSVVARPFSRFFNLHELKQDLLLDYALANDFDCQVNEKIDGSIIKLYCYKGTWYAGTKSTAFADNHAPNTNLRFFDLFVWGLQGKPLTDDDIASLTIKKRKLKPEQRQANEDFLQEFAKNCQLNTDITYLFELASPLNKDVIERPLSIYWLGAMYNQQDEMDEIAYIPNLSQILAQDATKIAYELANLLQRQQKTVAHDITMANFADYPVLKPNRYDLKDIQAMEQMAKSFGIASEGFVVNINSVPKVKIKSPEFVIKSHQIDTDTLSPTRLFNIIFAYEEQEWIANFPQDEVKLMPYVKAREQAIANAELLCRQTMSHVLQRPLAEITVIQPVSQEILAKPELKKTLAQYIFANSQKKSVSNFALALSQGKSVENIIANLTEVNKKNLILENLED